MNDLEVLQTAQKVAAQYAVGRRVELPELSPVGFPRFTAFVMDILKYTYSKDVLKTPYWVDFATSYKRLYDDFEMRRKWDPAILYQPQNDVARRFHKSLAFCRFFKAGNRTSKTTSGYLEDYFVATGQSIYRPNIPNQMNNVFIVGLEYAKYAPLVFEPKLLTGEQDNILSPLFPEDGKWFYHYDQKTRQLTLRCKECAETREAGICAGHHKKGYITLFSDEGGSDIIEGFTGQHGHIDEIVPESFFGAAKTRLMAARDGTMAITCTPRYGSDAWQKTDVEDIYKGPADANIFYSEAGPIRYVEMFYCTMYEGGIVPKEKVKAYELSLKSEFERRARVHGEDAPMAENPVFDLAKLSELKKLTVSPRHAHLGHAQTKDEKGERPFKIEEISLPEHIIIDYQPKPEKERLFRGWRIWELPKKDHIYVIGADTAAGLNNRDFSCAQVFKVGIDVARGRLKATLVAKYLGWIPTTEYADELKKAGILYNNALMVPEITGIGRAVVDRLRRQLFYPNLFRDLSAPQLVTGDGLESRIGVDTNYATKPAMVAAAQAAVEQCQLEIFDSFTIDEMANFEQERTALGIQTRYRGAKGSHDDQVMALIIACYVIFTYPIFDLTYLLKVQSQQETAVEHPDGPNRQRIATESAGYESSEQSPFD